MDDFSTDKTVSIAKKYPVRVVVNENNLGIGLNLAKGMEEARGKYILYLCADDYLFNSKVASDVCKVFDAKGTIGVIGRYYFFFMDGKPGAIGVHRDKRILISSCCPSGMAFRKMEIVGENKIFCEMPLIVKQYILKGWEWTMLEYDTVASRYKPGENTGTKTSYYTQSVWQNWVDLVGKDFEYFPMFVMLKNRAPKMLWGDICLAVRLNKKRLLKLSFWIYTLIALLVPRFLLKRMSIIYRNKIGRLNANIIKRGNDEA